MESWRVQPLPPGWSATRLRILKRDLYQCTAARRDGSRCPVRATDVHHIYQADDHSDANLTSLCGWHHDRITAQQGNQARNAKGRATERRPRGRHPGLIE